MLKIKQSELVSLMVHKIETAYSTTVSDSDPTEILRGVKRFNLLDVVKTNTRGFDEFEDAEVPVVIRFVDAVYSVHFTMTVNNKVHENLFSRNDTDGTWAYDTPEFFHLFKRVLLESSDK